jgi:hypothetical protein
VGWKAELRAIEAAERRRQREAQRRLRDLERRAKEQAKLSAIEKAQLEVATYENRLEVLLSVHKEQGQTWDWAALATSLSPPCPQRNSYHEFKARQRKVVLPPHQRDGSETKVEEARLLDEQAFQEAMQAYSNEKAEWVRISTLGRRIHNGDHKAYIEALVEFNPFTEISDLGSSINFTVHSAELIECVLKVNGRQVIPPDVKSLTATEKVSTRSYLINAVWS